MSNKSVNNDSIEDDSVKSPENDAITSVEVLKGDEVIYEEEDSAKEESVKEESNEEEKSAKEEDFGKEESEEAVSDKEESDKEDKYGATIANIYQWAAKLKDEFKSEASDITHDISEKAAAMMLTKLLNAIDTELENFDKKVKEAKDLIANAETERSEIAKKKEKYQGMIDQLDS